MWTLGLWLLLASNLQVGCFTIKQCGGGGGSSVCAVRLQRQYSRPPPQVHLSLAEHPGSPFGAPISGERRHCRAL